MIVTTLEKALAFYFEDHEKMPTVVTMSSATRNALTAERVSRSPVTSIPAFDLQNHLGALGSGALFLDLLEVPMGLVRIEIDDELPEGGWKVT